MIYQISGLVLVTVSIICFTWYMVTLKQMQMKADARKRREQAAKNERLFNNNAMGLYEDERTRREAAETKVGILERQLKLARGNCERLKLLIKELEENA